MVSPVGDCLSETSCGRPHHRGLWRGDSRWPESRTLLACQQSRISFEICHRHFDDRPSRRPIRFSVARLPRGSTVAAMRGESSVDVGRLSRALRAPRYRSAQRMPRGDPPRLWGLGKMPSIVARRDAQYSQERTTHLLFVAEAATLSNSFDSVVRFPKPATRCVDSDRLHYLRRGAAAFWPHRPVRSLWGSCARDPQELQR